MQLQNTKQYQALTDIKREVYTYLLKYVELICSICQKPYNQIHNIPMIVCLDRHRCCSNCVPKLFQQKGLSLNKCFHPRCQQILLKQNIRKDIETIMFCFQLKKKQSTRKQNSSEDIKNMRTTRSKAKMQQTIQKQVKISQQKEYIKRLKDHAKKQIEYVIDLQKSLKQKRQKLYQQLTDYQNQLRRLQKQSKQLKNLNDSQKQEIQQQLQGQEVKNYLNMNFTIDMIQDIEQSITSAESPQVKQQNCKITQKVFGQPKNMSFGLLTYLPNDVVVIKPQQDQIMSGIGLNQQSFLQAPLHVVIQMSQHNESSIMASQNEGSCISSINGQNVYAYVQKSIGKLLKKTKNLWKFLRIQKQMANYTEKQFIDLMCQEMKKTQFFSGPEIYKFQGYENYKDLLQHLIKQYTKKLYLNINSAMSSTDPITISRMKYFLHLMLKNYKQTICGELPSQDIDEYYRYTKISMIQFRTYAVGGFIFFTTLTSCSYEGQPIFSHCPSKSQMRIKYVVQVQKQQQNKQFNSLLDVTKMSKYQNQKQVLFFPYQIFVIVSINEYPQLKLAEVFIKQVPKKYIIKEIEKPQNQIYQTLKNGPKVDQTKILSALQQTKSSVQQNLNKLKEQMKQRKQQKQLKIIQNEQNIKKIAEYGQKHNLKQILKKLGKGAKLQDVEYLNLTSCKLNKIEYIQYFPNLKGLCLWDNEIQKIQNLQKCFKLRKNRIKRLQNLHILSQLKQLSIYDNDLKKDSAQYLSSHHWPNLQTLSISFNQQTAKQNDECYIILLQNQQRQFNSSKKVKLGCLKMLEIYKFNSLSQYGKKWIEQWKDNKLRNQQQVKLFWYD